MTNAVNLVFIPSPGLSHLVSTLEASKLLLARDSRLSVTVLIIKYPQERFPGNDYAQKISSITHDTPCLRFIHLPADHDIPLDSPSFSFDYIDSRIDAVRQTLSELVEKPPVPNSRLAGLVLDMFCTNFVQVAHEFEIPSYVFFTSGACSIGLFFDLISLKFEHNQDLTQYRNSNQELSVPCFSQPLPAKFIPSVFVNGGPIGNMFLEYFKRIAECKGVVVNTFYEFESYAIESLSKDYKLPKVYPVGPILKGSGEHGQDLHDEPKNDVINWLDDQEENSVVFLCFGTMGAFDEIQVKEFAKALENCGSKFLWSLRKPGATGMYKLPVEYDNFEEVLPEGFLERTAGVGKVIGWAPQVAVLAHKAVGGFVSHCGWNSTLESVWSGVPVATLPMYAEQQMNAFQLVRELGIAEEIRLDYSKDMKGETASEIVPAEDIEAGIRRVMADGSVRAKVKEMQRKARAAVEEGGSSYKFQIEFVQDVIRNVGLE